MKTLGKILFSAITFVAALVPLWLFVVARCLLAPQGFWQNLALTGAGVVILGGFQITFLIFWIVVSFHIWTDD